MTNATATISKPIMTSAFQQYETLLIQLASAMRAGDKERANAIRREMDVPERELDDAMLERLDGLSADLYMLDGKEYFERTMPGQAAPRRLLDDLKRAWDDQDWEVVLRLLRQEGLVVTEEYRAYLRAIAYEKLGLVRSALAFMDHAAAKNLKDVTYRYQSLDYLDDMHEDVEAFKRASAYIEDENTPPVLRIRAAVTLERTVQRLDADKPSETLKVAARVLAHTLSNKEGWGDTPREAILVAYVSLGMCLGALGDSAKAADAYRLARQVDPEDAPSQKQIDNYFAGQSRTSRLVDVKVPDEAAKAHSVNATFLTLKTRQIWLAAA